MTIKPTLDFDPIHINGPAPSGWYRAKLIAIKDVTTKKGKPGKRFEWETINGHPFNYTVYQTFGAKSGLLSKLTYWWVSKRISEFPKNNDGGPNLAELINQEADILVEHIEGRFSNVLDVLPPGSYVKVAVEQA